MSNHKLMRKPKAEVEKAFHNIAKEKTTVGEVAKVLKVSKQTIYRHLRAGTYNTTTKKGSKK